MTAVTSERRLVRLAGELLVTAGVVLLLFVGYDLVGTGRHTAHAQTQLRGELAQRWLAERPDPHHADLRGWPPGFDASTRRLPAIDPAPPVGRGVAVLYLPSISHSYRFVVVEGVDEAALEKGPGHYPGTALPGQRGNLVVSGHRTTYLAPFNRIDELQPGDPVIFETSTAWWVYRVTDIPAYHLHYQEIVDPSDVAETLPVPNQPGVRPTKRIFTLTTCNPKYSARQRLIVHGLFVRAMFKPAAYAAPSR